MSSERIDPDLIIPKPQMARVFGMLHILYGVVLCFFSYTAALMFLFAPVGSDLLKAWMSGIGDVATRSNTIQARRLERLKELATRDDQRAGYEQRLAALKASPIPNLGDMPMGTEALENPVIRTYSLVDLVANLPLNILMIVGGVGLVQLREWGRKGSWWASVIKVAAMAISAVYLVVVISPIQSRLVMEQLEAQQQIQAKMMKGTGPGAMPFSAQTNSLIAASATASGLFWIGVGAAYPITALVMLRRPSIRAACWRPSPGADESGGLTP